MCEGKVGNTTFDATDFLDVFFQFFREIQFKSQTVTLIVLVIAISKAFCLDIFSHLNNLLT
jgi:ABC-type lipoprotein release transport system permease subunit